MTSYANNSYNGQQLVEKLHKSKNNREHSSIDFKRKKMQIITDSE